jgi:hypothetical protein
MAAGDGHVVNNFKEQLLLGAINCATNTFKMALYSDAYATSQIDGATNNYSATNEIGPANYVAGGQSVGTCVVTQNDASDNASWDDDGTDVLWSSLGSATIQRAVLYDDTTSPKHIAIIWEIGTNSNGGNYTIQFAATGMMLLS